MKLFLNFLAEHWASAATACSLVIFLWRHGRKIKRVVEIAEREFKPNGGKSLRDQTNRMESMLERVGEKQRIFAELVDIGGILHMDENGKVTAANRAATKILRQPENQIVGDGWLSSLEAGLRESVRAELDHCIEEVRRFDMKVSVSSPTNQRLEYMMVGYPERSSTGELLGFTTRLQAA